MYNTVGTQRLRSLGQGMPGAKTALSRIGADEDKDWAKSFDKTMCHGIINIVIIIKHEIKSKKVKRET